MRSWTLHVVTSAALALLSAISLARAADTGPALPPPLLDMAATRANQQTAVFAGGCFWGVQGVFQHVDGVIQGSRVMLGASSPTRATNRSAPVGPDTPRAFG